MIKTLSLSSWPCKRPAFSIQRILLLTLCIMGLNSCKKELLTTELQQVNIKANDAQIQSLSFQRFIGSINLETTGKLKQVLTAQPNINKQILSSGQGILAGLVINADSVKKLVVKDTISYVLSIKLEAPTSAVFKNLTIQQTKGNTIAFLSTYMPSKEWIIKWRTGHLPKFEGTVSYQKVPLSEVQNNQVYTSDDMKQVQAEMICAAYVKYELVPYPCIGIGVDQHWPGEPCQLDGQPGAPHWGIVQTVDTNCEGGGGSGGEGGDEGGNGGTGGGGNTTPNYPEGYDPCASGEIKCSLPSAPMNSATFLINTLNISPNEPNLYAYLTNVNNMYIFDEMIQYLSNNGGTTMDNIQFLRWAINYLSENTNVTLEEFKSNFLDLSYENMILGENISLINNGIEISDVDYYTIPPLRQIASTRNRGNTEDLTYGTNHDATGVKAAFLNKTNTELYEDMASVMRKGTIFDSQLQQVAINFLDIFYSTNTSNQSVYSDLVLNQKVRENGKFIDFMKLFGARFNDQIRLHNGDINAITNIDLGNIRPVFNGYYNMPHGLTILLNDTEQTKIHLVNFTLLPNNKWEADFEVEILDHFGLDKNDVLGKQRISDGFPAWWVLQHRKGKIPFITKVVVRKRLNGDFN